MLELQEITHLRVKPELELAEVLALQVDLAS
jgi:hypothetical protein